MRILITGASGFVGKNLVGPLLEGGHEIFALARSDAGLAHQNYSFIEHDFCGPRLPKNMPEKVDHVVQLATSYRHRDFPDAALDLFHVNCCSTILLLDYARQVGAKGFSFCSSGSVYDGGSKKLLSESARIDPDSYFPATKYAAELFVRSYRNYFDVSIHRLFFPYGPGQHDRLIPSIVDRVRSKQPIQLRGDPCGMAFSQIFIADVVTILQMAITERWSGIYNLASPQYTNLKNLAILIGEQSGIEPIFDVIEDSAPQNLIADVSKLQSMIGEFEFTSLESGLTALLASG